MKIANDILVPELARLLAEEKEVRFTPSGVSMRPFIEGDQDSVILAPLNRPPRKGDILLAHVRKNDGQIAYVLHRLVAIRKDDQDEPLYVLQGDGNPAGEERCGQEDIIGRVIRIERPDGKRKMLTRGRVWHLLLPFRPSLLKIYRHTWLKWYYK